MPTRKDYISRIWVYKKRRDNLSRKISQWQNEIRRIDLRNSKWGELKNTVNIYFHVDISSRNMDTKHKLARNCYYKYGMENGFQGAYLSKAIGRKRTRTAAECRRKFTRSFAKNITNKTTYHNFKNYIQK